MDFVLFSLLHQTTKTLKEIAKALGYYRGLFVESTGDTTVSIKADILFVEGIPLQNVDLTLDLNTTGANGRDGGDLASGDIWFIFVITDDIGSNIASYASKTTASPENLSLPSGYTKARLISFCSLSSATSMWPFSQRDCDYFYGSPKPTLAENTTISTDVVSYSVYNFAPYEICNEVILDIHAEGTSDTTADVITVQQTISATGLIVERGKTDGFHEEGFENDFVRLRIAVPISSQDYDIEFYSGTGNNTTTIYVAGAKLKI